MAGGYINSKAGKKRIKKKWKNREKKDELHTFKDTTNKINSLIIREFDIRNFSNILSIRHLEI